MKSHLEITFGWEAGSWVWCLHCERAYKVGEFRTIKGIQYCPYEDCDGTTVMDAWSWDDFRNRIGVHPEEPEKDVRYVHYPF
jgi:hypothetical protein